MGKKATSEEIAILEKAEKDFLEKGQTNIVCPRCGEKLYYTNYGSAYSTGCKTPDCIKFIIRGL